MTIHSKMGYSEADFLTASGRFYGRDVFISMSGKLAANIIDEPDALSVGWSEGNEAYAVFLRGVRKDGRSFNALAHGRQPHGDAARWKAYICTRAVSELGWKMVMGK